MAEDELTVKLTADASDLKAKLGEATEQVKNYGNETANAAKTASDGMTVSAEDIAHAFDKEGESCNLAAHAAVEHGREVRNMAKEMHLTNMETVLMASAFNQLGTKVVAVGKQFKGSTDLLQEGIKGATTELARFSPALSGIIGTIIVTAGSVMTLASNYMMSKLAVERFTMALGAKTVAQGADTAVTAGAIPVMAAFNATMMANPILLVGAAIAGVAIAIGVAIDASNNYSSSQAGVQEAITKTMEKLDALKTKLRQTATGEGQPADLVSQKKDLEDQIAALESKRAAATAIGLQDKAEGYRSQIESLQEDLSTVSKEIDLAQPVKVSATKLGEDAAAVFAQAREEYLARYPDRDKWWYDPGEKSRIERASKSYAEASVHAYLQQLYESANSEEARYTLNLVAERYGEPFKAHSPPKVGPLKDIKIWGRNLMESYGQGMREAVPSAVATSERIATSIASTVDNRRINNINNTSAPNIHITGMMDLSNPAVARMIAKTVDEQLKRRLLVS